MDYISYAYYPIRGVALLTVLVAGCSDSAGPRSELGSYQFTITYEGQQTMRSGRNAAFYRYDYGGPGDTAIYFFISDSLTLFQFEHLPSFYPVPGTDSVHSFAYGSWLTVEYGNAALKYAQLDGEPNTVTFDTVTPDSIVGTFALKFLIADTATVVGRFNAAPTSTFRGTKFSNGLASPRVPAPRR